jgi:hypothetical protein
VALILTARTGGEDTMEIAGRIRPAWMRLVLRNGGEPVNSAGPRWSDRRERVRTKVGKERVADQLQPIRPRHPMEPLRRMASFERSVHQLSWLPKRLTRVLDAMLLPWWHGRREPGSLVPGTQRSSRQPNPSCTRAKRSFHLR